MSDGSQLQMSFCPRFYYLHPLLAGPLSEWPRQFQRISRLGFDHVLLPSVFAPGRTIWLTDDYERLHPALEFKGTVQQGLKQIADAARNAGLGIVLDAMLDRSATGGRHASEHANWLTQDIAGDPPDPRRPMPWQGASAMRLDDPWVAGEVLRDWSARIRSWLDAGIAGVCVQTPQRVPRSLIEPLMLAAREHAPCRFVAATTGLQWNDIDSLVGQDYDAVFGSTAWWDFKSDWLLQEHEKLSRIAPVIASCEAPFEPRTTRRAARADLAPRAAKRALRLAIGSGCGWLMPMGFEYGAIDALSPTSGSPEDFRGWQHDALFDLSPEITQLNQWVASEARLRQPAKLVPLSGAGGSVSALLRSDADPRQASDALLLVANADLARDIELLPAQLLGANAGGLSSLSTEDGALALDQPITLAGGDLQFYRLLRPKPVLTPASARSKRTIEAALKVPRVAIEAIAPAVDGGDFHVKRIVGDVVIVEADAFMDGHDSVAVALLWRPADESDWRELRMRPLGNDRWVGEFPLERLGRHLYTVEAWRDAWASYRHEIEKKHAAKLQIAVELQEGLNMLQEAAARLGGDDATQLAALLKQLAKADDEARFEALASDETAALMRAADTRAFSARHEPALCVDAEPPGARYASWYELFPRSMSFDENRHGTFRDVIAQLPRVRDMGFDVLYFPPIHPIGEKHRKGRNNSLTAGPDDPGSPYAIGSRHGGYDAVDPRLGTLDDFRALRDAALEHGLQLALDFAIQCSPDHPWLKDHPEWFAWRPDGTIKYAENPPKKYEDIVNVDFYSEGSMPSLWVALRDAVLFWCNEGVRLFRVDNPHTKPLPFWKWMIADVRGRYPDALFLAEAFTRPKLMRRLAKIGYSQSYTYFTWRNGKAELTEYLTELNETEMREYFRPHFFVNTPDINPVFLQGSGRPGFVIRAALAATLSGLWGVYSGFELCEAAALPGKEEYLDSEKYQIRVWDWNKPGNISGEITLLNRIRKMHPALQTHLGLKFLPCWNDQVLYYCKATPDRRDVLLIAVSLDPHNAQEADFEIPLWDFGLPDHGALAVEDLVHGHKFQWHGKIQHLRLTPDAPFAIWRVAAT
ncbi:alpha-1,4-glucan--maltose-1-phosphate maltosyltransferase [Hydrocarboniphaga sp.]|uniref:alpha-1,4-glucan--maltose-1-phosphate maltosyltransferase n=1 Tax=Hydrocarboniphaga sp. TaxID=2033016 RepID=UPI003D0F3EAE